MDKLYYTLEHDPIHRTHDICIFDEISSDHGDYAHLIHHLMLNVHRQDQITLRIASYGGSLDSAIMIINALRSSGALLNIEVMAPCYSAAAIMALCGDSVAFNPNTYLMFHNFSNRYSGKFGEIREGTAHDDKHYTKLMGDICAPFLTKKELSNISSDIDVYVSYDDKGLDARIKRHFK